MIVSYSNIATNIVVSLPGRRRQWLVYELEGALVIIFGELQSKHFICGGGEFGACAEYFLGRWGKQWPGKSIHYVQVQRVPMQGPSVVFISCASSL